ncbi:MAG TPA: polysaccharide deacetylase family protein [Solirubrobacteraceae bacterium]|nr:polysaccharide deacetylase family protein [Solirubrobacteraceae bacterium]
MNEIDHRSRAAPITGALAAGVFAAYALPALAGLPGDDGRPLLPGLRAAIGVDDRTSSGAGFHLTFDDGPHPQGTPAVLEVLARHGVRATFFLVGEQVRRDPALVGELLAAGHGLGLHCDRHRNLLRLTPWQVREDLARAEDTITAASGRPLTLYRPPYGVLNTAALVLARRRAWRTLLWRRWGQDWRADATPERITERVSAGAAPGDVLLLHDADDYSAPGSWRRTVAALPLVLEQLACDGLVPVQL